jgi:hypothetical protein
MTKNQRTRQKQPTRTNTPYKGSGPPIPTRERGAAFLACQAPQARPQLNGCARAQAASPPSCFANLRAAVAACSAASAASKAAAVVCEVSLRTVSLVAKPFLTYQSDTLVSTALESIGRRPARSKVNSVSSSPTFNPATSIPACRAATRACWTCVFGYRTLSPSQVRRVRRHAVGAGILDLSLEDRLPSGLARHNDRGRFSNRQYCALSANRNIRHTRSLDGSRVPGLTVTQGARLWTSEMSIS